MPNIVGNISLAPDIIATLKKQPNAFNFYDFGIITDKVYIRLHYTRNPVITKLPLSNFINYIKRNLSFRRFI